MLTSTERDVVLRYAAAVVRAEVERRRPPPPPDASPLHIHAGAFVTLHKHGELCGCIGYTESVQPLSMVIARCARAAALEDPRFPPLRPDELPGVAIEISILGPIEPIADASGIDIGRHGVIVESGSRRALLLPQVAVEHHWTRDAFLTHACLKADLPARAWEGQAALFRFEAEVFGSRDPVEDVQRPDV